MWALGNTCVVTQGDQVFVSGIQTLRNVQPLNNVRWILLQRRAQGWDQISQGKGRTREPCPLAVLGDRFLLLSDNPTLVLDQGSGPAQPEVLFFRNPSRRSTYRTRLPAWDGNPEFTEHSYRSFAADSKRGEFILFQNVGYTHAEWVLGKRRGQWLDQGRLVWPWESRYARASRVRICYPTVALRNSAVYFCGVSDIIEPRPDWRSFKKELTGQHWDYEFRRLFFTWSPNVTNQPFREWIEVSSREETCGWILPCDLWVDRTGDVHLLWSERALDERLRERYFPWARQRHALKYCVLREGKILHRISLCQSEEGLSEELPGRGRFHVTQQGRLYVLYHVAGKDHQGNVISENRILEIGEDGHPGEAARVPFEDPFLSFYSNTWRAGCEPSDRLHLFGYQAKTANTMSYGRVHILQTNP